MEGGKKTPCRDNIQPRNMSTAQLRRKIKKDLASLPATHLQSAADFIAFLGRQANGKKGNMDPRILRLRERIRQADQAESEGRLIPLEKLRRRR
jgi:hypothetical protein